MKTLFQVSIKRTCREGFRHEYNPKSLQWNISSSEGTKDFDTLDEVLACVQNVLEILERIRLGE